MKDVNTTRVKQPSRLFGSHGGRDSHDSHDKDHNSQRQQVFADNLAKQGLSREQVIATERKLAKFANTMDSLVRIPFTQQGIGADAALSTVPIAGDVAGLILTGYAFILGRQLGVPVQKMIPAIKLALVDMVVGIVPAVGTLLDIFIRPSRKTLTIVHQHLQDQYGIDDTMHLQRPFLHESLENKQRNSKLWRNPVVAWLYLHIPDILGLIVLLLLGWLLWSVGSWVLGLFSSQPGF